MFYRNIEEIKQANKQAGKHFFSPDTMRFFNSRILSTVYRGRYFITSERAPRGTRRYSIREATPTGDINTIGEFQRYHYAYQAVNSIKKLPDTSE